MHLTLRAPNIWFRARLRYPDPTAPGGKVDVQGFTLPGLPLVVAGGNGHVAWGFTNSYIDTQDWKMETPCTRAVASGYAPLRAFTERIEIAHKSTSRAGYAQGSLRAVRFLAGKRHGLFDMSDVLGLK